MKNDNDLFFFYTSSVIICYQSTDDLHGNIPTLELKEVNRLNCYHIQKSPYRRLKCHNIIFANVQIICCGRDLEFIHFLYFFLFQDFLLEFFFRSH